MTSGGVVATLHSFNGDDGYAPYGGLAQYAVEELLRYESPCQHTARMAREHLELGGKQIRKRMAVMAAGNRDPERFPDPDRLDINRKDKRHLALGRSLLLRRALGTPRRADRLGDNLAAVAET